jgi:hypothetical protein
MSPFSLCALCVHCATDYCTNEILPFPPLRSLRSLRDTISSSMEQSYPTLSYSQTTMSPFFPLRSPRSLRDPIGSAMDGWNLNLRCKVFHNQPCPRFPFAFIAFFARPYRQCNGRTEFESAMQSISQSTMSPFSLCVHCVLCATLSAVQWTDGI